MQYADIFGNIVIRILASSDELKGKIKLPDDHQLLKGDDVRFFDKDFKRLTKENAIAKQLIDPKENQTAVWEKGWTVKDDYTKNNYWNKETGRQVRFKIGEKPDDTVTDIPPSDSAAQWDGEKWELPAEVIEQRAKDLAKSDLENIDKTSVSALREAVIALINGEVVSEKTKDILMAKEVEAIDKKKVLPVVEVRK